MSLRLSLALAPGGFPVPDEGRIAVFGPRAGLDLSALPKERLLLLQPLRPDYEAFQAKGFDCAAELPKDEVFAAAIVFLPRAKAEARMQLALAAECCSGGPVLVDGAKTDGVDSALKALKARLDVSAPVSKAHGKIFWFSGGNDVLQDWISDLRALPEGFVTAPGVFSADGVDPASALLAASLPAKLGRSVADLGAGWGYLSREILTRADVEELYLVEADSRALDCARRNLDDPRPQFFWQDARHWKAPARLDAVVMNPPFHTGRSAEPELGKAFILSAARQLAPSGQLWMVANRHLPYEESLAASFAQVKEVGGDTRFKILHAQKPRRNRS
ncbi:methyltransferase, putative [Roseobacter sp. SK209-2-6]|uniref:class I SAM-dependent methyltransferase n=1 Tax=Roseobacter sp. SK209-2-6 TaxID=388739 RepID=UPI0000F3D072|nr:class I SAM-dependent methyltransferase [Roseobacter sp. SK209-2-6]EBA15153.1 methyltransferase, putative [Roseobacter sp. SK209-2-6]